MRYFVKAEFVELGASFPPKEFVTMVEKSIIPSFEVLEKLEKEKILVGGIMSGARAGFFIVDVESNVELSSLLESLPFWGLLKWETIPLDTPKDRMVIDKRLLENIKKSMPKEK